MSETLQEIKTILREIMGDEFELDGPVERATEFSQHLELESIELVMFAEKIQGNFGDTINFADWLASKDLDEVMHLKVGDVVDFIDNWPSSTPTE